MIEYFILKWFCIRMLKGFTLPFLLVSAIFSPSSFSTPKSLNSNHWFEDELVALPGDTTRKVANELEWSSFVGKIHNENGINCSAVLLEKHLDKQYILTLNQCVKDEDVIEVVFNIKGINVPLGAKKTDLKGQVWYDDWIALELLEPQPMKGFSFSDISPSSASIGVAGYSLDITKHLGDGGNNLTYDDNCELLEKSNISSWQAISSCFAYPGAQGGAYIHTDKKGGFFLAGLIVAVKPGVVYAIKGNILKKRLFGSHS